MARLIEFNGRQIEVPDDTTDAELAAIMTLSSAPAVPAPVFAEGSVEHFMAPAFDAAGILDEAARRLAVAILGDEPHWDTAAGLKGIIFALGCTRSEPVPVATIERVELALTGAMAEAIAAAPLEISASRLAIALGAATALLKMFAEPTTPSGQAAPQPMVLDRIDHVMMVANDLETHARRQHVANRGDLLRRYISASIAWAQGPATDTLN